MDEHKQAVADAQEEADRAADAAAYWAGRDHHRYCEAMARRRVALRWLEDVQGLVGTPQERGLVLGRPLGWDAVPGGVS